MASFPLFPDESNRRIYDPVRGGLISSSCRVSGVHGMSIAPMGAGPKPMHGGFCGVDSLYHQPDGSVIDQATYQRLVDTTPSITLGILSQIVTPSAAAESLDQVNKAMAEGEINSLIRKAAFLAQIAHETAGLTKLAESGSDSYFESRYDFGTTAGTIVGNTIKGDGVLFKGRGMIQLTGRENYTRAWLYFNLPVERDAKNLKWYKGVNPVDPTLAVDPDWSAKIAGWYWAVLRKVNPVADQLRNAKNENAVFEKVTKKINGGLNGLTDRLNYYKKAKHALGIK